MPNIFTHKDTKLLTKINFIVDEEFLYK